MDIEPLLRDFRGRFGRPAELGARAPGRVNLIGEHTDYNDGLVLPGAIDREAVLLAARRPDRRIRVYSRELSETREFDAGAPERGRGWIDHVQGVVSVLGGTGVAIEGLDVLLASEVPLGSGLSSSAALGVAAATLLDRAQELGLGPRGCARAAHRSENSFVGLASGPMDQLASALGRRDHALRIDCRDLSARPVPLPGERVRLLVVHSGVRRELAGGEYNQRRRECEAALEGARAAGIAPPGARALRDLSPEALGRLQGALAPRPFRRARHVILENRRVERTCAALAAGDLAAAGSLLREGMRSLRDDYEVSIPELDFLCALGDRHPGVYGSRLTGAGFGGCTLHLVEPAAASDAAREIARAYRARFGREARTLLVRLADGAGPLELARS